MRRATIDDVAALAGVSIKTVSRVLNNEPHVREATRERVRGAAETLGYQPNFAARALAGSRSYLIGLYFDNRSTDYISAFQFGAMDACRHAGFHLVVEHIDSDAPETAEELRALLATVRLDGVILTPPVVDKVALLDILDAAGVPYIRIAPAHDPERSPRVRVDDRGAARQVTRHLINLGHRRIAFVRGHPDHSAAEERLAGFRDAMRMAGLPDAPDLLVDGDFSFEAGLAAAEHLLSLAQPPTAVFAANDPTAAGVISVANRRGLHLPDDLSVAGFDDSPIAQIVWPPLTTVRQPITRMAAEAAGMLVSSARAAENDRDRLLDVELVIRGSTAPPRG